MEDQPPTPEQQPVSTPTEQPVAAPTPVEQPAPQPPQPQFAPQQPQQQVQYVVSQQSLEGVGGWLIFWLIVFILMGIGYIMAFFSGIESGGTEATDILLMIFSPLLAIGAIGSATTIALRKKLGVWLSIGTLGLAGLYTILSIIVSASQNRYTSMAVTVGAVLASLVFSGAMILYFVASKRVKQTLTK